MKTKFKFAAALLALLAAGPQFSACFAQGSLTPPGAPAPAMKTLAQLEPRTPISSVPFTINVPGSYYLTTNVSVSSGAALTIAANNVALDLKGFTISSTENPPSTSVGVLLGSVTNVAVMNGSISGNVTNNGSGTFSGPGFLNGIAIGLTSPVNIRVERVTVSGCKIYGVELGYVNTLVESCSVNSVGLIGIEAVTVSDSQALNCGSDGMDALTANNCFGSSAGTGTGVNASAANNCFGIAAGSGNGLTTTTASSCYGSSASGYGISANSCIGCFGSSTSNYGVSASMANNCEGLSTTDTGLNTTVANSCYGQSSSGFAGLEATTAENCYGFNGSSSGNFGLNASTATGCYGYNSGTGTGLESYIANVCRGVNSSGISIISTHNINSF
jgi:hypothetical protein